MREEHGRQRAQKEFDSLPGWAQKMVRGLAGCASYGGMNTRDMAIGMAEADRDQYSGFHVLLRNDGDVDWFTGFLGARELSAAMTAPWPPADIPVREQSGANI